mgnify:FL=1
MTWLLLLLTLPWSVFLIFTAVMRWKAVRREGKLTKWMLVMAVPWLVIGYPLDVLLNFTWGSLIFGMPKEWTCSARLWYWSNQTDDPVRRKRALRHRVNLLDPIDPDGTHKG